MAKFQPWPLVTVLGVFLLATLSSSSYRNRGYLGNPRRFGFGSYRRVLGRGHEFGGGRGFKYAKGRMVCKGQSCGRRLSVPGRITEPQVSVTRLSECVDAFSVDVYKQMAAAPVDNFFFSSFSVFTAMAMVVMGAAGNTERQINNALSVNGVRDLQEAMAAYISYVSQGNGGKTTLSMANAIYTRELFHVKPTYVAKLRSLYQSAVKEFQYVDPHVAINQWVAAKTGNMITDFLGEGAIDPHTDIILVNAIYFKGLWKDQFKPERTMLARFHVSDDEFEEVEMMYRKGLFKIQHSAAIGARVLELPYQGDKISMFIFLPYTETSLDTVESGLSADNLGAVFTASPNLVLASVKIPKFALDTSISLKEVLRNMGVEDAFDARADFRKITDSHVQIDAIQHRAVIEVDEQGTRAAAATRVHFGARSSFYNRSFVADRPFMFVIRDKANGLNLFMGRYCDPAGDNLKY